MSKPAVYYVAERENDSDSDSEDDEASLSSGEPERTLAYLIGYLIATNAEDWSTVLEVCDRVSLDETNAEEAVKALRREFKHGQPHDQLGAAKLWTIMLRHSTDAFVSQCGQRKFLDTLEDVIKSGQTAPIVKERLLESIAAAAYTSASQRKGSEQDGFRGLWLRVKPADRPDEGIPFDPEGAMFNPSSAKASTSATTPAVALGEASSPAKAVSLPLRTERRWSAGTGNRINPRDEDIRRLFQECKVAAGNATLLSEALLTCTPSSFKRNPVIKELYTKCENQQKLIFSQIEWAAAQAEQSRASRNSERDKNGIGDDETIEEKLLAALLGANEELLSAVRQYDDLFQIVAEKRSRKGVRIDRREVVQHQPQHQRERLADVSASRSSAARSISSSASTNGSAPFHEGYEPDANHALSHSYQGTTQVVGGYAVQQGTYPNQSLAGIQPHGQQVTVSPNAPETGLSQGQTYIKNYRSPPEHAVSLLPPPPKAPLGPRAPSNFSLRSRLPNPNKTKRPDDGPSNNNQHSWVDVDYHGGAVSVASTHTETDSGSYNDHAHNAQQRGIESESPPLDPPDDLTESGRSTPVFGDQLLATVESGRTTPILTNELPAIIAATSDSMSVCLYPSGITEPQLENREDQRLFPTGDRDLDRFFGVPSTAGEESRLADKPEGSGKVVAVFKEASCIEISGGVFNAAGNDIHNYQTDQQVHYYSTTLPPSPQQKGPAKQSKTVWPMALLYFGLGVAIGIIPTAILKWIGRQ